MDIGGLVKKAANLFTKPSTDENPADKATYSVLNLHQSKSSGDLIAAHNATVLYYRPSMNAKEFYHDFQHPDRHWTEEEKEILKRKGKAAIAFSEMKSSWRTYIGSIIQNKYDITPSPVEPTDNNLAFVYKALYNETAFNNQTRIRDVSMLSESWIGGNAWQESFIEQTPGRMPVIIVRNQNNYAIYPDPNRKDLVTNSDCMFIDREGWYSLDDLISIYPEKENEIREALTNPTSITYTPDKPYADRQHEMMTFKNGRYKVIERQYKVFKRQFFSVDKQGNRQDVGYDLGKDAQGDYKQKNPGNQLFSEPEEFLYLAVCCPSMGEYLYNGPYHCQPRDARTKKVMFTYVELIDEEVGSCPSGHAEHMIGPNKVKDSLVVNMLAQAKNAAGQPHIADPDSFDEATQDDISKHSSDGNRVFWFKKGATNKTPISLVPQGTTTADTKNGIQIAEASLQDVSSTPPSMKGFSEGNVPASLNEQRIQQSFTQSQIQVANYMNFLTQRAKLWMFYWNEYYTSERVIRILEPDKPQQTKGYMTINQVVQDKWGNAQRLNTLQDAVAYDIVFEDSWQSPTNRAKAMKQLTEVMNSGAVANDPTLTAILYSQFLHLSDIPDDVKAQTSAYLDQKVQQSQQPPAAPPADKPKVSLSLKGDLHDPETLQFLEAIGELPQGFGAEMATSASSQVKQAGDVAKIHSLHLKNKSYELNHHSQLQGIADSEAQATTPVHPQVTSGMNPA